MTNSVTLNDGRIVDFPDGTPSAIITKAVDDYNAKLPQNRPFFPSADKLAGEIGSGLASGAQKGVALGLGLPADIATDIEAAGAAARTETPEAFEAGGLAGLIGGGGPSPTSGAGALLGSESIEQGLASLLGQPDRPESGLGKIIESGTEFGTSMVAPIPGIGALKTAGRLGSKLPGVAADAGVNLARGAATIGSLGALSGIGSEAAGQAFEGTKLEPYARVAGAIVTPTTPAAIKALSRRSGLTTSGMQVLEESVGGLSEAEKNTARRRAQAAKDIDVPLAPAEAIGQRGVRQLSGDVTATTQGARIAEQNIGAQPEAVRNAVEKLNKQVSPIGGEFSGTEIGQRVKDASEELVKGVRTGRSKKVSKFFKLAEDREVPIDNMSAFVDRLDEVIARAPVGGPVVKELDSIRNQIMQGQVNAPVTRIGTLDQIRQTSRENIRARGREVGAKKNTMANEVGPVLDDLTAVMEKASGEFAEGMLLHRQLSPMVDSFMQSEIAQLRNISTRRAAAQKAINMVTDIDMTNPRQIKKDMALFQKVDNAIPPNLTRMYLDQQTRAAFKPGVEGLPKASGVRLFNRVAGTSKQKANLNAMFSAVEKSRRLKKGTMMKALEQVLDGIEKAGTLPGTGSATAGRQTTFGRFKETVAQRILDWNSNARFDRNVSAISDLLTNPNRLEDLIHFTTRARKDITPREIVRALAIGPSIDEE